MDDDERQRDELRQPQERARDDGDAERRLRRRGEDRFVDRLGIEMVERRARMPSAHLVGLEVPMRDLPMVTGLGRNVVDMLVRHDREQAHAGGQDDRQETGETTHPAIIVPVQKRALPIEVYSGRA